MENKSPVPAGNTATNEKWRPAEVFARPGLNASEVAERLRQYGLNVVAAKKKMRPLVAFIKKFNSPLLWVIMIAATISFFVGEVKNGTVLVFMVFLSVVLDFVNTYRSEKAVDELIAKVVTTATVIRGNQKVELEFKNIVPDDVVLLSAGDVIPADGYIIDSKDFFVNQSMLTGESLPVEKAHVADVKPEQVLSLDRPDAVFMGTNVVTGYATLVVTRTGPKTEFGRVAERLVGDEPPTDFERSIKQFSVFLMKITAVMVAIVFLANLFNPNRGIFESFVFAIAIAIGLTPELLPVIITVSLSRGAVRMSKQAVIVKHLPAIQNFGRMDVLCTDKTGTLTENHIAVVKYLDNIGRPSRIVLREAYLTSWFHTGVPNPLDQAVKEYRAMDLESVHKIDEIPFDFERRRESVVVEENGRSRLITKGAPEAIIPICTKYWRNDQETAADEKSRQTIEELYTNLSQEGFKVLAVAVRTELPRQKVYEPAAEMNMTFLGFIALLDPPKKSALEAVQALEKLGVEIKILTGDSEVLTEKICREINLPTKGSMTGEQLATLADADWPRAVREHTIFARIDPEQKEQIITALQRAKRVVGFLGDGINDAPALKAADVGVSVNNAVDVAKETADIILLRQSLNVLKDGIIEGRKTFQNSMKYIEMGLSSNFGNMFSMMAASAFLPFLPMLPGQVLLNNFLYDTSQITLSTDSVDDDAVQKPTVWDIKFIRRFMLTFGPVSSIFDFATFGLMWWFFSQDQARFQTGWFIESLATQVFVIYIIRTRRRPFTQSRPSRWLLVSTLAAVTVAWVLPFVPWGRVFGLSPLPPFILLILFAYIVLYLFLVEVTKRWFYRRENKLIKLASHVPAP